MQTKREYLAGKGLAIAGARGRLSAEAHKAIDLAHSQGVKFSDDNPITVTKITKPRAIKVPKPVVTEAVNPKDVREWAKKNGKDVPERGRISTELKAEYLAGVAKEDRAEVENKETDIFRDRPPRRYPEGTTFEGKYWKGNKHTPFTVTDRAACSNCGVSLCVHTCNDPKVVYGGGNLYSVTPIYK